MCGFPQPHIALIFAHFKVLQCYAESNGSGAPHATWTSMDHINIKIIRLLPTGDSRYLAAGIVIHLIAPTSTTTSHHRDWHEPRNRGSQQYICMYNRDVWDLTIKCLSIKPAELTLIDNNRWSRTIEIWSPPWFHWQLKLNVWCWRLEVLTWNCHDKPEVWSPLTQLGSSWSKQTIRAQTICPR